MILIIEQLSLISMAGAPDKCDFLKDGLNIVDVISILPFFVSLFFLSDPAYVY